MATPGVSLTAGGAGQCSSGSAVQLRGGASAGRKGKGLYLALRQTDSERRPMEIVPAEHRFGAMAGKTGRAFLGKMWPALGDAGRAAAVPRQVQYPPAEE